MTDHDLTRSVEGTPLKVTPEENLLVQIEGLIRDYWDRRAAQPVAPAERTVAEMYPGCVGFTNGCHCQYCMGAAPATPDAAPGDAELRAKLYDLLNCTHKDAIAAADRIAALVAERDARPTMAAFTELQRRHDEQMVLAEGYKAENARLTKRLELAMRVVRSADRVIHKWDQDNYSTANLNDPVVLLAAVAAAYHEHEDRAATKEK